MGYLFGGESTSGGEPAAQADAAASAGTRNRTRGEDGQDGSTFSLPSLATCGWTCIGLNVLATGYLFWDWIMEFCGFSSPTKTAEGAPRAKKSSKSRAVS